MKKITFILCALLTTSALIHGDNLRIFRHFSPPRMEEHILTDFSSYNSLIRIEDGSHFKTPDSDAYTLSKWRSGDRLMITPNSYYFSFYDYSIRNLTLGTSILANLQYGPSIGNRFSKQVDELDYRNEFVRLTDDSYWAISDAYLDEFYEWKESDYIIIGSSKSSRYKSILINVTLNHYVEANLYD